MVATEKLRFESCFLARCKGVESVVDAVDQLTRSNFVADRACAVDGVVTDSGFEVDLNEIAGLDGTVNGDQVAKSCPQFIELGVDLCFANLGGLHLQGVLGKGGDGEVGAHIDLDIHDQVAREVLVRRPGLDISLGLSKGAELFFLHGRLEVAVQALAHRVVDNLTASYALVNDGRGNFAFAEAGNVHFFRNVLVGVIDTGLELLGAHRDGEAHPCRAEGLFGGGRQCFSPNACCCDVRRGDRIRTCDLPLPKRALYQAELRPDGCG